MPVKEGDVIKVEYEGRLEDGTVFDSSEKHGSPLQFVAGGGQMIKGFDKAVLGMNVGEEKEITLPPSEAYGEHNDKLIHKVPREQLPKDKELKPGMVLIMNLPDGRQIPTRITEVNDSEVTIDINPPLAGKTLIFKIKIVEIEEKK